MTAIVGILNKKAAVMAADSALTVTRGDTTRIYNNTTKIFKLSDKYPVAVMTFSSADFMGVPLNVLINMYKEHEGEKDYKDLQGYVDNFIQFLDKERCLHDDQIQHQYLRSEILTFYEKVKAFADEDIHADADAVQDHEITEEEATAIIKKHFLEGIEAIQDVVKESEKSPRFERYSFEKFQKYAKEDLDALMELCKEEGTPEDMRDDWEKGVYDYVCSDFFYNGTGLVFVGYGTDEIYPSLIPIYVSGIFDGNFRYCYSKNENEIISNENESAIVPFAQTDVMMTVMKGMSPVLREKVDEWEQAAVQQTKDKMIEAMKEAGIDEETIAKVQQLETKEINDQYSRQIQDFQQSEYINGLVDTVEAFGIEDMANMAESLIEITNLQRHITASEESVGGPVDVAVLTRDRGFVWMKHHDWAPSGTDVDFRKKL